MHEGGWGIVYHVHHGEQGKLFLGGTKGRELISVEYLERGDAVHVLKLLIAFPYTGLSLLGGG